MKNPSFSVSIKGCSFATQACRAKEIDAIVVTELFVINGFLFLIARER